MRSIIHVGAHAQLALRGPAAATLVCEGVGEPYFEWNPANMIATDVELRARIESSSSGADPLQIPRLRWKMNFAHGEGRFDDPAQVPSQIAADVPRVVYSLPARGMVLRFSTRGFKIVFQQEAQDPPIAAVAVKVSCQPVVAPSLPIVPYEHAALDGVLNPLPMAARLWRFTDARGLPLAAAAVAVDGVGIAGGAIATADGADYFDWTPIPHDAAFYVVSAPCFVGFQ